MVRTNMCRYVILAKTRNDQELRGFQGVPGVLTSWVNGESQLMT